MAQHHADHGTDTADEIVRAELARADRLRRERESARQLWAIAPWTAAACALMAAIARLAGWSAWIPISLLALALAALAVYALTARRAHAITDAAAADHDARAGLGGELRSAYWFASHDVRNPWIEFHLARAADRVRAIDWAGIYPAPPSGRARMATALLSVFVIVVAIVVPGRAPLGATATAEQADAARARAAALPLSLLPPALRKQIEAMLTAAEQSGGRSLTATEVKDLLAKLDELRAGGRGDVPPPGGPRSQENKAMDAKALAERVKRDADNLNLDPEVKDALTDMANKLSDQKNGEATAAKDSRDAAGEKDAQKGDSAQSASSSEKQDGAAQSVQDAASGGGVGVVMMSADDGAQSKEAGMGLGGGSGDNKGGGAMPDLAAALKRETVEAKNDNPGENIPTEIKRKTEHGDAAVAYTHVQPGAAERGRSTAPPAVPENRRAAVRSYFTRKQ